MYPATPLTRDSFKCQLLLRNTQAPTLATVSWEAETQLHKLKFIAGMPRFPNSNSRNTHFSIPFHPFLQV